MSLSANSIIHYTRSFDNLSSIIAEGFRIKYCAEKFIVAGKRASSAAHPMVSFCDIPLSQSEQHAALYGSYGIGLTKTWANHMGINPVLYLEENSSISKTLAELLKDRRNKKGNLTEAQRIGILRIKSFTKNYSGKVKTKTINKSNYRFYDEREWRLVPTREELDDLPFSMHHSTYVKDKNKYNEKLAHLRYKFKHVDIAYIIVNLTSEIPAMIKLLQQNYEKVATANEMAILFSTICSIEQIRSDY